MKNRQTLFLGIISIFIASMTLIVACDSTSSEESSADETDIDSLVKTTSWSEKNSFLNKIDVYYFEFKSGQKINFSVSEVSDGSVSQIALYSGEIDSSTITSETVNLFTGNTSDYGCISSGNGCNGYSNGESITDFNIPSTGVYAFAVVRNYGNSCGGNGTYKVKVTSDSKFSLKNENKIDFLEANRGRACSF